MFKECKHLQKFAAKFQLRGFWRCQNLVLHNAHTKQFDGKLLHTNIHVLRAYMGLDPLSDLVAEDYTLEADEQEIQVVAHHMME